MIVLVGLPGSGKSTIGQLVAQHLGLDFFDTDHQIEKKIGMSIKTFFSIEGEDKFRELESEQLSQSIEHKGVLSTGGGIVLRPANRELIKKQKHVFYLHASTEALYHRLKRDKTRPLLQGVDPKKTIESLYALRDPLYREVAHHVIDTKKFKKMVLVGAILDILNPS